MKLGRQFRTGVGCSNSIPKYVAWRQNDVFDAMALYANCSRRACCWRGVAAYSVWAMGSRAFAGA